MNRQLLKQLSNNYPNFLKKDLEKHGAMTGKQKLVALVMLAVVILWIVDKSLTKQVLGFSLGLGGVAISGAVLYMLLGLTSWKDYEDKVSWGVIVLYAGCISLGSVFKSTGASSWFADQIMGLVAPLGLNSGVGLVILVGVIGAVLTNLMSAGATADEVDEVANAVRKDGGNISQSLVDAKLEQYRNQS